ncbi:MAG: aminopeptidase N [Sphingomicrobium sp.]
MADIRTELPQTEPHAEAPVPPQHLTIRREDYRVPDWLVPEIALRFTLDPDATRVQSRLVVERNPAGVPGASIRLNGDDLKPVGVWIDGVASDNWAMDGNDLIIALTGDRHELAIETAITPTSNSRLMGLYASGGNLATQCEAEGFRRITFFPDRPDVLSTYTVRMEADRERFPVLLSNGNRTGSGDAGEGRHWAEWHDPFPKPCYLFALVAGDLAANRDSFTTMSGRKVDLAIWVKTDDLPRTAHAMDSLKLAMKWDEDTYGREYDLDQFNIVAVSDFNMGAMENKSLNIFNTAYILADQDSATDMDFDNIARVVAHEYFHNWSGNRVTCRDWFQLSLKEGFTVFRDQSFSADMGSDAVKRIEDVRVLRAAQFPEDAGPLAHPVRPDSFIEISNFYTATIYNKGAELIRMMATILGPDKFRAGTDLYFERHDGEAATCDQFVKALEDASGVNLSKFKRWYSQAGTPRVRAKLDHDPATQTATLTLAQQLDPTPGEPTKEVMPIPLRTALIGAESGAEISAERLIMLDERDASVTFADVTEPPLLSINRHFSAPVIVEAARKPGELERLALSDSDPFARFEAMQELMGNALLGAAHGGAREWGAVVDAIGATLSSNALDPAFKAEAILLPGEALIADRMRKIDPDAIHVAREDLRHTIGTAHRGLLEATHGSGSAAGSDLSPAAKGVRRLRTVALGMIAAGDPAHGAALAKAQFDAADNMTDRQGALSILVSLDQPQREEALAAFHDRFRDNPLVIDKWFAIQATAQRSDTIETVENLLDHAEFTMANPNRLRALAGTFGVNQWVFNSASGEGYRLLAEMIIAADKLNPQVAARLIPPFGRWRKFEPNRSALMRAALERIAAAPELSRDVYEQASKLLA